MALLRHPEQVSALTCLNVQSRSVILEVPALRSSGAIVGGGLGGGMVLVNVKKRVFGRNFVGNDSSAKFLFGKEAESLTDSFL